MKTKYSEVFEQDVVMRWEKHDAPYIECFRCGKPLKNFWVIQSKETGIELAYVGSCCVDHIA